MNWPMKKKVITTLLYGLTTFTAAFASSVYSSATDQVQEEFCVSKDVATLGTALLMFGFGAGPLISGLCLRRMGGNTQSWPQALSQQSSPSVVVRPTTFRPSSSVASFKASSPVPPSPVQEELCRTYLRQTSGPMPWYATVLQSLEGRP